MSTTDNPTSAASESVAAPLRPSPGIVVWTLCQRELVRFFRQRNRVIGALGQPIIFWLLFSEGFKSADLGYQHFFPGTLAMILMFTAIFATISIIEDRREGFMQTVLIAPVARWSMVLGKILGGALIALVQGLLFLALGWLTLDALQLSFSGLILLTVLMLVISLALTSLGFAIAWRMDSTQGFHAIMSVFLLPMWLLSGSFFPAGEEGILNWIVRLNPLTYGVSGLRGLLPYADAVEGAGDAPSPIVCWIVSLLFAVVMFAVATRVAKSRTTGYLM